MELKQDFATDAVEIQERLNRTFMELKLVAQGALLPNSLS